MLSESVGSNGEFATVVPDLDPSPKEKLENMSPPKPRVVAMVAGGTGCGSPSRPRLLSGFARKMAQLFEPCIDFQAKTQGNSKVCLGYSLVRGLFVKKITSLQSHQNTIKPFQKPKKHQVLVGFWRGFDGVEWKSILVISLQPCLVALTHFWDFGGILMGFWWGWMEINY